ncbi:AsmA family protein (DUF3971 domain) [Campylobacter blaseri]|uniref:YhdP family protein n=1 Tax=Campylobacter blaseri TaxID=2042961 RepID=UPI00138FD5C1|nr:AsmA-like C-terminal domain-containing protein [Campylobacter blaseri]QKF86030.1 AsmA family protein (DUF3971 domain) [Campylobacter blaseri]
MFYIWLKQGININNLNIYDCSIGQLYIKFDNKFIVHAKNINFPEILSDGDSTQAYKSTKKLKEYAKYFQYINKFFKNIELRNVQLGDEKIEILYKDNIFFVDTSLLTVDTQIIAKTDSFYMQIKKIELKDFDLTVQGDTRVDFNSNEYLFDGVFKTHEIDGHLYAEIANGILKYTVEDASANSLGQFTKELGIKTSIHPIVQEWLYGKTIASKYYLEYFSGEIDLENLDYRLDKLNGQAFAYDLSVEFNEKLPPVTASRTFIELKDEMLFFTLQNPKYQDKDISGSSVLIDKIFKDDPKVIVDLRIKSTLDKTILDLIKTYDIELPIIQKSGETQGKLTLNIDINSLDVDIKGDFKIKDAIISLQGTNFYTSNTNIDLSNSKVVIKDSNLELESIFKAVNLNGQIDVNTKKANFDATIDSLTINSTKNEIFKRDNFQTSVDLDFSKSDVVIKIPNLDTEMIFGNQYKINIENVANLYPYSKLLQEFSANSGSIYITTNDFVNFNINTKNLKFKTPLIKKDGTVYTQDDFSINIKNNIIEGKSKSGYLAFNMDGKNTNINISNLDLPLEFNNSSKTQTPSSKINFHGDNSFLILKDINKSIDFNTFNGNIDGEYIYFLGHVGQNGKLSLKTAPGLLYMHGENITGNSINKFLNYNSFNGGTFSLKAIGKNPFNFKAEIGIKDTHLKDYVFYHQLLSFLNSVPSLLTFKTPDFNDKGFSVKDGKIYLSRKENIVEIEAMELIGTTADMGGKGYVNLDTKEINVDLEIKYLKDASSIIKNIPIVNQIILGKNRTISTVIEVRGTLDKPKYSSKVVSDILTTPFSIIKNTLELPFVIFE